MTVVQVDYNSDESLRCALHGHDVLVSALGKNALDLQPRLIDAAVSAGVRRIIPSEFGGDLRNHKTRKFPTYRSKVMVEEQLERLRLQSGLSYTLIFTSCLLDWGLSSTHATLLNPSNRTIRLYDGGDKQFSATSIATLANAVVAVLHHYEETANRAIYIHDVVITQNELLEMAREATAGDGGKDWVISHVDTAKAEAEAYSALKRSANDTKIFYGFAIRGAFGEGYGGHFLNTDNELLGIKEMDIAQVKELVRKAVFLEDGVTK